MVDREKALSPTQLKEELVEIRSRLLQSAAKVTKWRQEGMQNTLVPVSVLPLEVKIKKMIQEIDVCLQILVYIEKTEIKPLLES